MRLYIEGHSVRRGHAISRKWSNAECSTLPPATPDELKPVRFVSELGHAKHLVERWNRRFATHQERDEQRFGGQQ